MLNIWEVQMLLGNLFLITRKICFSLKSLDVELKIIPFPPGSEPASLSCLNIS